jgi:hypothetical protein
MTPPSLPVQTFGAACSHPGGSINAEIAASRQDIPPPRSYFSSRHKIAWTIRRIMPYLMQLDAASVATYHIKICNNHQFDEVPDDPAIINSQRAMYSTPGVSPTGLAPGTASGVVQQASTGIDGYHSTGPCSLRGDEASMGHSTEVSWGLPRMPGVLLLGSCTPRSAAFLEMVSRVELQELSALVYSFFQLLCFQKVVSRRKSIP